MPATQFCIWIVSPPDYPHSGVFDEVALGLRSGFARLDMDVPIIRAAENLRGRAIVLGAGLLPKLNLPILPPDLILFNLEQVQPGSPWFNSAYLNLLQKFTVWDYSRQNIRELRKMGITNVAYCGIGYEPELSRIPAVPEDIDILFYGSVNERRKKILDELLQLGIKLKPLFGVYGAERDAFIARAKIILNIHFYEARILEIVRISYLLANKKFVISEIGAGDDLAQKFERGIVFAPYEQLVEMCLRYLNLERERREIAERGFRLFKQHSQAAFLREALKATVSNAAQKNIASKNTELF